MKVVLSTSTIAWGAHLCHEEAILVDLRKAIISFGPGHRHVVPDGHALNIVGRQRAVESRHAALTVEVWPQVDVLHNTSAARLSVP